MELRTFLQAIHAFTASRQAAPLTAPKSSVLFRRKSGEGAGRKSTCIPFAQWPASCRFRLRGYYLLPFIQKWAAQTETKLGTPMPAPSPLLRRKRTEDLGAVSGATGRDAVKACIAWRNVRSSIGHAQILALQRSPVGLGCCTILDDLSSPGRPKNETPSASPFDHARQELRVGKKHLIADSNFLDWFAFAAHVRASIMDLMN